MANLYIAQAIGEINNDQIEWNLSPINNEIFSKETNSEGTFFVVGANDYKIIYISIQGTPGTTVKIISSNNNNDDEAANANIKIGHTGIVEFYNYNYNPIKQIKINNIPFPQNGNFYPFNNNKYIIDIMYKIEELKE